MKFYKTNTFAFIITTILLGIFITIFVIDWQINAEEIGSTPYVGVGVTEVLPGVRVINDRPPPPFNPLILLIMMIIFVIWCHYFSDIIKILRHNHKAIS